MQEKQKKNTEISARISIMLDFLGITPNMFAKQLGYERSQIVYDTINGKSAPSYEFFKRFEDSEYSEQINISWLIADKGEMLRDKSYLHKDEQNKELAAIQVEHGIPLIPLDAFAGFGTESCMPVFEYDCEQYVIPNFKGAEFLIPIRGGSMYPKYASGDIVACKKISPGTFFQWNKVYVLDTEQGVLIKRVKKAKDDKHITLVSENERYEPFEVPLSGIRSLAIVIGVIRLE